MASAVESSANPLNKIVEEQAEIAKEMGFDLAPPEGEAGPSHYNTPSSHSPSPEEGASSLDPAIVEAILTEPLPGLEKAIKAALPDTPTDSKKSSRTSSTKGKEKTEDDAALVATADSEVAKKESKAKETVAAAPMLSDAELALRRQKEAAEEEKVQWLERYRLAQPGQKLLSVQDPEFQQLLAVFRVEKEAKERAERERKQQDAPRERANPEPKLKLRRVLSHLNLRRRLSDRRARHSQAV